MDFCSFTFLLKSFYFSEDGPDA